MKLRSGRRVVPDPLEPDTMETQHVALETGTRKRAAKSEEKPSPLKWSVLPADIRVMILEQAMLLRDESKPKRRSRSKAASRRLQQLLRKRGRKACPGVCSEWRDFFDSRSFASLTLDSVAATARFREIVTGRRTQFVRRIHLHVELPARRSWTGTDKEEHIRHNNDLFTAQLLAVLRALSTWETSNSGLTLELSAAQRGNKEHKFQRDRDNWLYQGPETWRNARNARRITLGNLLGLRLSTPERVPVPGGGSANDDCSELPEVRAVTRLVVSRSRYRSLSWYTIRHLFKSFTRLEEISYEPWRGLDWGDHVERDHANEILLRELPASAKRVSLWEASFQGLARQFSERERRIDELAEAAVEASRRLEFFSACFAIDARQFFRGYEPGHAVPPGSWPKLTSLVLTSDAFGESAPNKDADSLLRAASMAVERMPKLEVMELWSSGNMKGFIFRYEVVDCRPKVTVEATWKYKLRQSVLAAWQATAKALTGYELEVEINHIQGFDTYVMTSMWDRLRLKEAVRVPVPGRAETGDSVEW